MRIKVGDQLEVWTQDAASPVGAWRGGQVTWGNGHSYTLQWHDGGEVSARIPRKSVRPCPPPAPVPPDLEAGDMVEVFDEDDCLWKCAEVQGCSDAAAGDDDRQFEVNVGVAKVLTVPPRRLRIRHVLSGDDVWIQLHKDNQITVPGPMPFGGKMGTGIGRGKGGYKPTKPGPQPLLKKRDIAMLGSNTVDNGKRFKAYSTKMICAREERRDEVEVIVTNACLNKQYDRGSKDHGTVRIGSNSDDDHHQQQEEYKEEDTDEDDDTDTDDSDSTSSSDDSSSDNDSDSDSRTRSVQGEDQHSMAPASRPCDDQKAADQLEPRKKEEHCEDMAESLEIKNTEHCEDITESREIKREEHCEDIAASCEIKRETEPPMDQATVQERIHRFELEAYDALMKAFHACGKQLSWEKMDLLTDLREHLHISNEEHLQVLNTILNRKLRRFGEPHNL